jgi:[ribosomal protein S5]-alanine N-acetyltransferase
MNSVTIPTDRLVMRSLQPGDANERYAGWFEDPEIVKHINAARLDHDVSALRKYIADKASEPNVLFLGLFLKDSLLHIGNLKFEPVDVKHSRAIAGIMIGDKAWRGKGISGEALVAASRWLYENCNIKEIALGVTLDNQTAQRAYLKCGFEFASLDYLRFEESYAKTMVRRIKPALEGDK